jgi:alpha-glucosidase (family GH31 glycosyl hydrolase)
MKLLFYTTVIVLFCANVTIAQFNQSIKILVNEFWWGGSVGIAEKMPFGPKNAVMDQIQTNHDSQVTPVMLSSEGRYIWSEKPYRCRIENKFLLIEGTDKIIVGRAGTNLRDAYLYAAKYWYPSNGTMPDLAFFNKPQWNTWIELGYNQNQSSILAYAHRILNEGFPPGIIMLDDTWQEDYGNWTFNEGRFPDPKGMIDELHALGFKVMLWVIPCVSPDSYHYRELRDNNALLIEKRHAHVQSYIWWLQSEAQPAMIRWWNGVSAVLDLTKPYSYNWFRSKLKQLQASYGVDGFKFDGGDWYFYPNYITSPEHASLHAQKYGELGLEFPLNEYRVSWKMGGKPLVQRLQDKRHSWAETQMLIPHTLIQCLSGYNFPCPDMIGGGMLGSFDDKTFSQEIYVRSAQIQAMLPMMQFSLAPWRALDETHLRAVKQAVQTRKEKIENTYLKLIQEYTITNMPVVRSMEFVSPHEGFAGVNDQFFVGNDLLIAPMVHSGNQRSVKLPKGQWTADDGTTYTGGQTIHIQVPLERIPYFNRVVN